MCSEGYFQLDETCVSCLSYCNVGEYRSGCGGTSPGECLGCTNGPTHALYLSPGEPYNNNSCSWVCKSGMLQVSQQKMNWHDNIFDFCNMVENI